MLTRTSLAILTLIISQALFVHPSNSQFSSNLATSQQNNIEELIKQGVQEYRSKQYQKALQIYQIALRIAQKQKNKIWLFWV